jgi:peptide chain release factor 2
MRAEAQAFADQINAALALLRRFLDWDRALARLDELNARVEDPALWSDQKAAQEVMRERRRLDQAIGATRAIEKELADNVELLEMAEADGDASLADDAVTALRELAERSERDKVAALLAARPTPTILMSRSTPAPAAPKATTGPACSAACTSAGPSGTG